MEPEDLEDEEQQEEEEVEEASEPEYVEEEAVEEAAELDDIVEEEELVDDADESDVPDEQQIEAEQVEYEQVVTGFDSPEAEQPEADQAVYEEQVTGFETPESDASVEASAEAQEESNEIALDMAMGAMAVGAVAMVGEVNAREQEREAKKRAQEEERKAREEERQRLAEERKQRLEEQARAAEEARANRQRPSFGDALKKNAEENSAAPAAPTPAVPAPPNLAAFGDSEPAESPGAPEAAAEGVAATATPRQPHVRPAHTPAPRPAAGADPAKEQERLDREAARQKMLEERKAADEAKRAEREAQMKAKAAERQASLGAAAANRAEHVVKKPSAFADMHGTTPAAPPPANSAMAEKMKNLAGSSMASQLTGALAQAKAAGGGSPVAAAPAAAGPAAPPPGANDYLDIIQHLDARAVFHEEYAELKARYETRLLVGGEVLQCTLVGLNAGLIDSVYRKLSKVSSFMERIEWKYVAIEPVIVVTEGGQKRDVRVDPSKPITIGRDQSSTIPIGASFVSRNHAEIRNLSKNPHLPPQWQLKDLGSTHGTTINGSSVRDAVRFGSDDHIELGRGFAATEYPQLQLISRAIPYGREDLNRMVVDVDLVIAVVEADREFEGQANLLRNLSDVQKVGGLLVLAVSKSGPIDASMDVNLDELRHASRVLKGTEMTRNLTAFDEEDITGDAEWLSSVNEFIDGFRGRSHAEILDKRKQITREEVVKEIRNTGMRLEDSLNKKLEESERNLQRVQDEISMAPRNLGSAENLRDDSFKALKQTLDDDTSFFADPLRPDSLTYYADKLARQLVMTKKGRTRLEIFLVEPNSHQEPHRWINGELSTYAKRHFDDLIQQLTGPQKDPYGITGIYQSLRELLGSHDKLRNTDLFSDDNYQRYTLTELQKQMQQALSADFVQYDAMTSTKIDNMIMYVITKTRFAVMFYMSMFSIIAVVVGSTRSKLSKSLTGPLVESGIWYWIAGAALLIVGFFTVKSYKMSTHDVIEEEVEKLREQLMKHYQAVAKKFVDDAKRVLTIHLTSQESKIKQEMGQLGSSRMAGGMAERNNPVLDGAKKERDDVQALVYAIGQERAWAEQAQRQFTPSPFVQVAPVRGTAVRRT